MRPSGAIDLTELYRAHVHDVGRWAERLAGPGFDLPDLVHEVFEIAQRRLPSFRGDSSVKTWLYGITEKVVRHRRRKDRLRQWLSGQASEVFRHLPAPGPSQHEHLEQKERSARVYSVLDRLPERDRELLILFEIEELAGGEIASLLGMKVANVWLRLHRARARFLQLFRELDPDLGDIDAQEGQPKSGRYGHAG